MHQPVEEGIALIVHCNGEPFEYPGLGMWGLEVLMMNEEEMYTTELIFDDEDDAYKMVKYFKSSIVPVIWEPPDEED